MPPARVQTQYSYERFGMATMTGGSTNELGYTGREDDGTGLFYYRARYYHPRSQRFVSEDPLYRLARLGCTSWAAGSQRFNLYSYVENDPLGFTDPLGLEKRVFVEVSG
jgi:RHS repeat-associated protein